MLSWGFAIKVDIDPKIDRDESANKSEASVLASMQYEEGRIAGNGRIELDVWRNGWRRVIMSSWR